MIIPDQFAINALFVREELLRAIQQLGAQILWLLDYGMTGSWMTGV